jgi:glycosyltransferase involved in cell wall biosynthesis
MIKHLIKAVLRFLNRFKGLVRIVNRISKKHPGIRARLLGMADLTIPYVPKSDVVERLSEPARTIYVSIKEALHEGKHSKHKCVTQAPDKTLRPHLAYISPLSPEKTYMANISVKLLSELNRYYEIDLVTDTDKTSDPRLEANLRCLSPAEFQRRVKEYDRVLYQFGSSEFQHEMITLVKRYPGTIVLNDLFLGNMLRQMADVKADSKLFHQALYRSHGYPALLYLRDRGAEDASKTYPCSGEIINGGQGVIVHSKNMLQLTERFYSTNRNDLLVYIPPDLSISQIAQQYFKAIESFAQNHPLAVQGRLISETTTLPPKSTLGDQELARIAETISENTQVCGTHQLLVDISAIVHGDYKTGIQRVVRSILQQLVAEAPCGYRVEPIFRSNGFYRYARHFMGSFIGVGNIGLIDSPISVYPQDIFLGLDLDAGLDETSSDYLRHHSQRGLQIFFVVYDLFPLVRPEWCDSDMNPIFKSWIKRISTISDGLICISQATSDVVGNWLSAHPVERIKPLHIDYFHLGGDIEASKPTEGLSSKEKTSIDKIANKINVLIVSTIEPRKGHHQALEAFEQLWNKSYDTNLVIVGKRGWNVEGLVKRIKTHPQKGRHLFWFNNSSDELLMNIYKHSTALLMASEGEGFGLPLIEAAKHGLPIIARDLPVFREVAGENAFYFKGTEAGSLASALEEWLNLFRQNKHPGSQGIKWLTWAESAEQLKRVLFSPVSRASWDPQGGFHWHTEASLEEDRK